MSITASTYKKKVFTKKIELAVVERLFWQLGTHFSGRCRCREVAVVERFKQEVSTGTKKVAVVEKWPLWRGGRFLFSRYENNSVLLK